MSSPTTGGREGEGKGGGGRARERQTDWTGTTSIEINKAAEPRFRDWLKERTTRTSKPLYYEEARDGGAEHCGVSPKTTPYYIAKCVSPQGDYIMTFPVVDGKVRRQITYKHTMLK
jgi:hypothetical protein